MELRENLYAGKSGSEKLKGGSSTNSTTKASKRTPRINISTATK